VVDGDPVQPGPELGLAVEPGQGEIGLQEDLLKAMLYTLGWYFVTSSS
jgi:hypothetical protein